MITEKQIEELKVYIKDNYELASSRSTHLPLSPFGFGRKKTNDLIPANDFGAIADLMSAFLKEGTDR
jgi:hypothetical protein